MRILTLDIETSPNVADVWSLWNVNVGLSQLRTPSRMMCWAAKWHGRPKVMFRSEFHDGREAMVAEAHALLEQADVLVTYNGKRFDTPNLHREFLLGELPPPAPFTEVDLYQVVKSRFRFPSNKLDHIAQALDIGKKASHEGHGLWTACIAGDEKAWGRMKRYNQQDVRLTEELYDRLLPWVKGHPHHGLYADKPDVCQRCGHGVLHRRGLAYTPLGVYQQFQCQGCKGWSRGKKSVATVDTRSTQ